MKRAREADWREIADKFAAAMPVTRLDPAVLRWVEANQRSRRRWSVALSGGADSVAVLLLLWALWPRRRKQLHALHFDHRLRGAAAARADRMFCRQLCRSLGVRLTVGRWQRRPPRGGGALKLRISEDQARIARMEFLWRHANVLWLGHHQDDVAETLLMRMARGNGTRGLAAPRPVQRLRPDRTHLRLLLGLRKTEILGALEASGGRWREDESNHEQDYFRNRVRLSVVPALQEAAGRNAVAGLARTRELLEEDDEALEQWVRELGPVNAARQLVLAAVAGKPRGVVRRAVFHWLLAQRHVVSVSRQAIDALVSAVERGNPTRHSLGVQLFAVLHAGRLSLESRKSARKFQGRVN